MRIFSVMTIVAFLTLFHVLPGFSQATDELKALKEEIKALRETQTTIQKDLQEIKNLLRTRQAQPQAPPPFKEAVVSIDAGQVKGDKDAKLVMIDFSEYQ